MTTQNKYLSILNAIESIVRELKHEVYDDNELFRATLDVMHLFDEILFERSVDLVTKKMKKGDSGICEVVKAELHNNMGSGEILEILEAFALCNFKNQLLHVALSRMQHDFPELLPDLILLSVQEARSGILQNLNHPATYQEESNNAIH